MTAPSNPTSITLAREPAFRLGAVEVRPSTREAVIGDEREVLEPRVMQVLVALAKADGEVVTRDDLMTLCWEGRVVGDDALNRVIGKIRRLAARPDSGFALETIRKVGYRLAPHEVAAAKIVVIEAGAQPSPKPRRQLRWQWVAAALSVAALTAWVAFAAVLPPHAGSTLALAPTSGAGLSMVLADLAMGAGARRNAASMFAWSDEYDVEVAETPPSRPLTGAAPPRAAEPPGRDGGASNDPMSLLPPA